MKSTPVEEKLGQAFKLDSDLVQQMTRTMVDDWTAVNARLVSYAQNSLRANITAAEELRHCQSPQDMMDAQMRLARQAYDDYLLEARQIGDLLAKMSSDAMGYLTRQRPM